MLIALVEKYSLQLDLVRLKSQAEVAKNKSLANERPTTCMQRFAELSKVQRSVGTHQGDSNNSSSVSIY